MRAAAQKRGPPRHDDQQTVQEMSRLRGMTTTAHKMLENIQTQIDELRRTMERLGLPVIEANVETTARGCRDELQQVDELRENHERSLGEISLLTQALGQVREAVMRAMGQHKKDQETIETALSEKEALEEVLAKTRSEMRRQAEQVALAAQNSHLEAAAAQQAAEASGARQLEEALAQLEASQQGHQTLVHTVATLTQTVDLQQTQIKDVTKSRDCAVAMVKKP
eukprot:TRINITY_DN11483_c0_g1_i1.p1 TRINITY_DN11483_c0_g1~~TRINITY_DN11483_c0_g1_i1.p1  ORF type:complete len:225 (-),score=68.93 TRINITY_DN11483_c0_g1_i1:183-857(-)